MNDTTATTTTATARPFATVLWNVEGQANRLDTVELWHSRRAGHDDLTGIRRILAIRYLPNGLSDLDALTIQAAIVDDADGAAPHAIGDNAQATCAGSGAPLMSGARCTVCGKSYGHPHPAGLVVGAPAPTH